MSHTSSQQLQQATGRSQLGVKKKKKSQALCSECDTSWLGLEQAHTGQPQKLGCGGQWYAGWYFRAPLQSGLVSNSQFSCFSLPRAGMTGVCL